jgi:pilus assembly protein CpaC
MTTDFPERRRAPLRASGSIAAIAGIAAALCLSASAAFSAETAPRATRELVPEGARGMIQLSSAATAEDVVRQLSVEKGKSVIVFTDYSVTRVSVGDPKIADVVVLRTQEIQIVAKEVGATNVVLWGSGGEIEAAIDLHVGSPYSAIESEIRRVIAVGDVHVESAGDSVMLTGSVPDAASVDRALSVARANLPEKGQDKIVNLLTVGGNQQVVIEVTVSEINRSKKRGIASNFSAQITKDGNKLFDFTNRVDGLIRPTFDPITGVTTINFADSLNFLGSAFPIGTGAYELFVNALDENGIGKILAEPTLVARTGETSKFLSGGEIPIPVASTLDRVTIDYKEFGVGVSFTPTVLNDDRIHLDVTTEVSQVDFGLGTAATGVSVPGFRTRRASTGVEVGDGQTFAIAGLLRDELTERANMYPLLGQIPIIGVLFRSSTFEKQTTELVVLVRPHLVKALDAAAPPPLPTDYFDEPNWFEFYLMGRVEGFDNRVAAAEPQAGFVGDAGYRLPASPEEDADEKEAK